MGSLERDAKKRELDWSRKDDYQQKDKVHDYADIEHPFQAGEERAIIFPEDDPTPCLCEGPDRVGANGRGHAHTILRSGVSEHGVRATPFASGYRLRAFLAGVAHAVRY